MRVLEIQSTPADFSRTRTYLPLDAKSIRSAFGEYSWTLPDAMALKQIVLLPSDIGSGNDQNTTIVWRLLVEDDLGVLQTRASLTYKNSSPDTSPPPSNPMAPEDSRGDVWDLGLTISANKRMQLKITTSVQPLNNATNRFRCGLVGTWLRDIE